MSTSAQTHSDHKKPSTLKIRRAVAEVEALYELGRRSRDEHGIRIKHGYHAEAAEELGVSSEQLRKARVFADPEKGYSQKELDNLRRGNA